LIALIVTVFEPVPDAGEAFRLNALEAKSIDHKPLAGAVTVTVPEPEPYPEILIFVELIDHASASCDRETAHRFQQEERSFRLRSSLSSNNKSKYENTTKRIHFPLMIVV
jgi:hypothetical protein